MSNKIIETIQLANYPVENGCAVVTNVVNEHRQNRLVTLSHRDDLRRRFDLLDSKEVKMERKDKLND